MIGKEIRLKRLIPGTDGKYFGLTVDHAIARGVMPGLDTIDDTLSKMVAGGPNAITMHKGIAEKCFAPYAGKVALVLKLTTFGVYHFDEDVQVADVEEGLLMGADAVSAGCSVGGGNKWRRSGPAAQNAWPHQQRGPESGNASDLSYLSQRKSYHWG